MTVGLSALLAALLAGAPAAQAKIVSMRQREELIERARVWEPVPVEAMDTLNGPGGPGTYKAGELVRCRYEEKDPKRPLGGHSKKFPCRDERGERLKVKYDGAANTEVFGEVAGARLFWALGFPAERMHSVKVLCENCPADPWTDDGRQPRGAREFAPATLQTRLLGEEMSVTEGEGWTFDELDRIDEKAGGSGRAEVDALKLLAVLVNHGDNTPNQQRLLCREDDPECARPLMYATDLGATFGGRSYLTSFRRWSQLKVWKDAKRCVADFAGAVPRFRDPVISEAGRAFLAGLLARLSEKQLRDLFRGARFDALGRHEPPIAGPDGRARPAGIDDWVRAFLAKRREIESARCPR